MTARRCWVRSAMGRAFTIRRTTRLRLRAVRQVVPPSRGTLRSHGTSNLDNAIRIPDSQRREPLLGNVLSPSYTHAVHSVQDRSETARAVSLGRLFRIQPPKMGLFPCRTSKMGSFRAGVESGFVPCAGHRGWVRSLAGGRKWVCCAVVGVGFVHLARVENGFFAPGVENWFGSDASVGCLGNKVPAFASSPGSLILMPFECRHAWRHATCSKMGTTPTIARPRPLTCVRVSCSLAMTTRSLVVRPG